MSARELVRSDLTVDPLYALETAMGRLHDIITSRHVAEPEQVEAARVLGDLALRIEENPLLREQGLQVPVIR
jgi:hypothetical protein